MELQITIGILACIPTLALSKSGFGFDLSRNKFQHPVRLFVWSKVFNFSINSKKQAFPPYISGHTSEKITKLILMFSKNSHIFITC